MTFHKAVESDIVKKAIDQFVEQQISKQNILESEGLRSNHSLSELIEKSTLLSTKEVDTFIINHREYEISPQELGRIKKAFDELKEQLNSFSKKKRFFILDTMNFFNSPLSLDKLLPAMILFKGADQQNAIGEFVRPVFLSIRKNVELLTFDASLFEQSTIHIDRGILYTFLSDLSNDLVPLFKESYILEFQNVISPVDLIQQIMLDSLKKLPGNRVKGFSGMTEERQILQKSMLNFIKTIQTHDGLYCYALTRNIYYQRFLAKLNEQGRFSDFDPVDVSKVFAGCLVGNKQLKPADDLIKSMTDHNLYLSSETIKKRGEFIDQLSPSEIHNLIDHIRTTLHKFSRERIESDFEGIDSFSINLLLKKIWTGFIGVVKNRIETITKSLELMLRKIVHTYLRFTQKENPHESIAEERNTAAGLQNIIIQKDDKAITILAENYKMVDTDVIAFRGSGEGASKKDYSYNSRLFNQDESMILRFHNCFKMFFEAARNSGQVKLIEYKEQKNIREFYVAYSFEKAVIALGITHLKNSRSQWIEEKDLFPYILLFQEAETKEFGRVLSREVGNNLPKKIYNESSLTENNRLKYYESLYYILHSLPAADWESQDTQICLQFLAKEIQKNLKEGKKMIYMEELQIITS